MTKLTIECYHKKRERKNVTAQRDTSEILWGWLRKLKSEIFNCHTFTYTRLTSDNLSITYLVKSIFLSFSRLSYCWMTVLWKSIISCSSEPSTFIGDDETKTAGNLLKRRNLFFAFYAYNWHSLSMARFTVHRSFLSRKTQKKAREKNPTIDFICQSNILSILIFSDIFNSLSRDIS